MQYRNIYINGTLSDLTIERGVIAHIDAAGTAQAATESVDCHGLRWALPGLVNMHTHSAMTLFRSVGSGMPLQRWLHEAIFPREAKLTPDDIRRGTTEACIEMKETGTTSFNDMYFSIDDTLHAMTAESLHGVVSLSVTDADFEKDGELKRLLADFDRRSAQLPDGVRIAVAPHSIYAVSARNLQYVADFAAERGLPYHIHISETRKEREDCMRDHGVPPVAYLDRLGVLDKVGDRLIGAHALWLDESEIRLLGDHRCTVVHCPNSNLKLGSGCRFLYTELRDAGVNVTLGTDGCASSDNLDMVEAMKIMSLLQKGTRNDPSVLPADEVLRVATTNGRQALGLDDNRLTVGNRADLFLVDLSRRPFRGLDLSAGTPDERTMQFLNRLIYAAHGDVISETIC